MSILKEINLVNDGVLFHWDGNNQHFSLFEPEYFGEKEKDQFLTLVSTNENFKLVLWKRIRHVNF